MRLPTRFEAPPRTYPVWVKGGVTLAEVSPVGLWVTLKSGDRFFLAPGDVSDFFEFSDDAPPQLFLRIAGKKLTVSSRVPRYEPLVAAFLALAGAIGSPSEEPYQLSFPKTYLLMSVGTLIMTAVVLGGFSIWFAVSAPPRIDLRIFIIAFGLLGTVYPLWGACLYLTRTPVRFEVDGDGITQITDHDRQRLRFDEMGDVTSTYRPLRWKSALRLTTPRATIDIPHDLRNADRFRQDLRLHLAKQYAQLWSRPQPTL